MIRHIGILAVTAEGAALCCRNLCASASAQLRPARHPEISLHGFPLNSYFPYRQDADWPAVAERLLASTRKLEATIKKAMA